MQNANVLAPAAVAFHRENIFLYDPDRPRVDPNDLYREMGNRLDDPAQMNHNCPMCHRTMAWEMFKAHAEACFVKWFHTMDATARKFAGAEVKSTNIEAVAASADGQSTVPGN